MHYAAYPQAQLYIRPDCGHRQWLHTRRHWASSPHFRQHLEATNPLTHTCHVTPHTGGLDNYIVHFVLTGIRCMRYKHFWHCEERGEWRAHEGMSRNAMRTALCKSWGHSALCIDWKQHTLTPNTAKVGWVGHHTSDTKFVKLPLSLLIKAKYHLCLSVQVYLFV